MGSEMCIRDSYTTILKTKTKQLVLSFARVPQWGQSLYNTQRLPLTSNIINNSITHYNKHSHFDSTTFTKVPINTMAATQHTSTSATVLAGKPRIVYSGTGGGSSGRGKSFTILRVDPHYIKHDANRHYRCHRLRLLHSHVNGLKPYCSEGLPHGFESLRSHQPTASELLEFRSSCACPS